MSPLPVVSPNVASVEVEAETPLADLRPPTAVTFDITVKGSRLTVPLNGERVIEDAELPGLPARGRIARQHHGSK